jgi:AcrR family transcriptional regulator
VSYSANLAAPQTRERILETAARLFSSQGYINTSLAQVAEQAQVSKSLIFWHFESKERLFQSAIGRALEPYVIDVLDDLAGLSELDQVRRLIDEYYEFVSQNVRSVRFLLSLVVHEEERSADVTKRVSELPRAYCALLADILGRAREKGVARADVDPTLHAGLIMSGLHGILIEGLMDHGVPGRGEALLGCLKATLVDSLGTGTGETG